MNMRDHSWFTLIDLNWGFWNVSLEENAKKYTGFAVPNRGVYKWNVMPFGLKISPTVFQRAIELALEPLLYQNNVRVYIDDIIISSNTAAENVVFIEEVMKLLRKGGFFINFKRETRVLGHIVSLNTLKPDPTKIQGLTDAAAPSTKRALISFCAAASYLRSYIPDFSKIAEPLSRL